MNPPGDDNLANNPSGSTDAENASAELRLPGDPVDRPQPTAEYLVKLAAEQAERRAASRRFGAHLFDRLAELGVASIMVTFNGSGDDGQIEDVTVWMENPQDDAPSPSAPAFGDHSLYSAVEQFIYDQLDLDHRHWELDAGSFGKYVLDIGRREVSEKFAAKLYTPGDQDDDGTPWSSPRYDN
jgi:hypothetical protein